MKMVNLRRPPVGVNLQGASYFGGMADVNDHVARVAAGGGTGANESDLFKIYRFLHSQGLLSGTRLLWTPEAGYVQRVDGVLKYCRSGFDVSLFENDLDGSATASQQPRLVGGIAPNSKPAASNQNGEARYFTHPAISFGASDAWSVTVVLKWDGNNETFVALAGGNSTDAGRNHIAIRRTNFNMWAFFNDSQVGNFIGSDNTSNYIGKNIIATFSANGGNIKAFVNEIEKGSLDIATNFNFSSVFTQLNEVATQAKLKGTISAYHIQSGALTPTQVTALYNTLRGMYPEIETVTIGSQVWASRNLEVVATPGVGNVIANVTDNAAWANATVLYDAAYAATSGTTAQKEYAGLKAAAMWCYYNNDPANGAIYGKLYNWYAAKLLDLDMASAGFGYHVPTSAEWTTLANALGGTSVAGGKMKMTGTDYWNTPNTGATNESGFTALGGGRRSAPGGFSNIKITYEQWTSDKNVVVTRNDNSIITNASLAGFETYGTSLRLIKNS